MLVGETGRGNSWQECRTNVLTEATVEITKGLIGGAFMDVEHRLEEGSLNLPSLR